MALGHRLKRAEEQLRPNETLLVICCAKGHPYQNQPVPEGFQGKIIYLRYGHRPCECEPNGATQLGS